MKRYLTAICTVIIILLCFSACRYSSNEHNINTNDTHMHSLSEWEILIPASCSENGRQQRACRLCDFTEYSEIEMIPHTISVDSSVQPTCESDGKTQGSHCSVCQKILISQSVVPKLGHTLVIDSAILPTCSSDGKSEGTHCSRCQQVFISQNVIPSTPHQYDEGVIAEEAFFWKKGKIRFSCIANGCNASYCRMYSTTTITQTKQDIPTDLEKLYSFCALSDIHITYETASEDFQRALTYAESHCDFTCIAGDLTSSAAIESQLAEYKKIVDTYALTKPVYAIAGNHEHYNGYSDRYLEKYTGHPLYYSFTKGNDVFIMVGHYGAYRGDGIGWLSSEFVSVEELQWLYEILETNRNKRCFIFTHALPYEHGVGNPDRLCENSGKPLLWNTNDGSVGQAFMSLLKHYKNTILFHGHSHTRFDLQNLAVNANCSDGNGYRSVHIPSLSMPRDAENGVMVDLYGESEGYIIDVYEESVVLKGRDFVNGNWISGATYKIETELYTIEANTFIDSTGTIMTSPQ